MFSGIVEEAAVVTALQKQDGNLHLTLRSTFTDQLTIDQSIAHNGVCLTVVDFPTPDTYTVTAIAETLSRSNLGDLQIGSPVNLERSMRLDSRLDGHIVQGHVDTTAICTDIKEEDGSWRYTFKYDFTPELARQGYLTVDKGSVTVNGVSLTVCNPTPDTFQVCIIPYTYHHTNFHAITPGSKVNIEFDILGKYIARLTSLTTTPKP